MTGLRTDAEAIASEVPWGNAVTSPQQNRETIISENKNIKSLVLTPALRVVKIVFLRDLMVN
jgi:hypothetical protein